MKTWKDCATQDETQAVTLGFTVEEADRLASLIEGVLLDGAEGEDLELLEATVAGLRRKDVAAMLEP